MGDGMMIINMRLKRVVCQTNLLPNLLNDLPNFRGIAVRATNYAILARLVKRAGRKRSDHDQEEQSAHET